MTNQLEEIAVDIGFDEVERGFDLDTAMTDDDNVDTQEEVDLDVDIPEIGGLKDIDTGQDDPGEVDDVAA